MRHSSATGLAILFMLQAGAGAEFTDGGTYGTVALRAILEF